MNKMKTRAKSERPVVTAMTAAASLALLLTLPTESTSAFLSRPRRSLHGQRSAAGTCSSTSKPVAVKRLDMVASAFPRGTGGGAASDASRSVSGSCDGTDQGDRDRPSTGDVDFDWKATVHDVFEGEDGDTRPVILFDGLCNLCHGGVNFALDHDDVGKFRFVSLQSKIGQALLLHSGKDADDISSIVLVERAEPSSTDGTTITTRAYFKSDAVLRIARGLESPWLRALGAVGPAVPQLLRNVVYDFVADNRYRFGHREEDSCRLYDDKFDDRFIPDP